MAPTAARQDALPAAIAHPPAADGAILALCAASTDGIIASAALCSEIALEDGKAPEWIQLFPPGPELVALDGRRWSLADPAAVAALSDERRGSLDLPIDVNHAEDRQAPQGAPSPAAAWIKQFAVRDGVLSARVEWTQAGRESVESKAYRYFSPSFMHVRKIKLPGQPHGGEVRAVTGGSLVNRPAFDMPALAGQHQEDAMNELTLQALGLAAGATEQETLAAIAALKSERDEAQAQAAVAPSLAEFVPRADYDSAVARAATAEGKLATDAKARLDEEIKTVLDDAQQAGRITPASRSYHESRCRQEGGLEEFKSVFGEGSGSQAPGPGGGSAAPPKATAAGFASAEEASIASMFRRDARFLNEHAPRSDSQGVS